MLVVGQQLPIRPLESTIGRIAGHALAEQAQPVVRKAEALCGLLETLAGRRLERRLPGDEITENHQRVRGADAQLPELVNAAIAVKGQYRLIDPVENAMVTVKGPRANLT